MEEMWAISGSGAVDETGAIFLQESGYDNNAGGWPVQKETDVMLLKIPKFWTTCLVCPWGKAKRNH